MTSKKFRPLHKLIILTAGLIWIAYVFLAEGIAGGVISLFLLLLTLIAMKVEI